MGNLCEQKKILAGKKYTLQISDFNLPKKGTIAKLIQQINQKFTDHSKTVQ
jgi:hypothetical protein